MTTNRNIGVSLTADPSQMQAGLRTAASSAQQFAVTTDTAFGRVSAASARLVEASKAVAAASNQQTLAARAQQAAADRFVRDLERQATAIGKTRSELLALQAAELGVADKAAPFIARIRESEQALDAGAIQFNKYGLSAKQAEAAMRGVPAQITDIVVALQGGQRPMTVLLQQGGQLKDMFGGIVPAAQALGSTMLKMVNPVVLAGGALAGLYAAYRAGAGEAENFNRTLIMTGNAAGTSVNQLMTMAARIDGVVGTQRQAAQALNLMAGSTKIAAQQFEQLTATAIAWERATGTAIADTVKQFEELGKAPVEASLKLNESMNYLTASTYEQIKALQDAGRENEAAALAQSEYDRALRERTPQIVENLGYVEKAWRAIKDVGAEAIDDILKVGRVMSTAQQLAAAQRAYAKHYGDDDDPNAYRGSFDSKARTAARQRIEQLQELMRWEAAAERQRQEIARREREEIERIRFRDEYVGGRLTREQQRIEAIQKEEKAFQRAIQGLSRDSKEYERIYAAHKTALLNIDKQFEEKRSGGISATQTELARLNALLEAERQREEALHSVGLAQANLNEGERLAIQYAEKLKLATDAKTKSQLAANKALAEEYGARKRANDVFEKELKDRQSAIDAARKQTERLRDEIETYGMGKSAIEAMTIARLEERLAIAEGEPELAKTVEGLREEIAIRKEMLSNMRTKEQLDAQLKEWQAWEREVDRIFDQLGQSLTDQLFEGGKSARDMLKDMFRALTLRVVVQPMLSGLQGMVTQQLGGLLGYQDPRQQGGSGILGTAQNLYSGYNAITGGLNSTLGNAAQWMGQKIGSEALTSFGLGLSGTTAATGIASIGASLGASLGTSIGTSAAAMTTTTFSAAMGGGALIPGLGVGAAGGGVGAGIGAAGAAAGGAAAGGAAGFGAAVGAALPWIGGALAIGGLLGGGLFDREPTTRREQRTQVEYSGGSLGVTQTDDRAQAGADQAVAQMTAAAIDSANSLFQSIGIDAAIESFRSIMASSYKRDRDGVASGGTLRVGDQLIDFGITDDTNPTLGGFGGWSSVDPMQRIGTEIQLSMLEALKAVSDELPSVLSSMLEVDIRGLDEAGAADLVARFTALTEGASAFLAAIEQMPFDYLRDVTFDAAANMIQLAGGLDNLLASQQTYYERFYSDAERHAHAVDQLTQALAGVGVEMPALTGSTDDMLASYRALVESLDLNTEAGQQAYVTLMQNAGAFADVAQFAGQAAVDAARYAEQVLREREGLERQLLQLQGDTAELRRRELAALDESNHALQERIWRMQDEVVAAEEAARAIAEAEARAKEIQQERYGLETQLLQLMGDTDALRARHLATLDESNHALQRRIWALQDEAQAAQDAERAAREFASTIQSVYSALVSAGQSEIRALEQSFGATDAAMGAYRSRVEQLRSDLTGVIDTMRDSVRTLRGEVESTSAMQYNQARAVISTSLVTGRLPQTANLSDAIQAAQQGVMDGVYATRFERDKAYLELANEIEAVQKIAEPQLTTAEATLERLEEQYDLLRGTHRVTSDSLEVLEYQLRTALEAEELARAEIDIIQSQLDYAKGLYDRMGGVQSSIQGGFSALLSQFAKITGETVPAFAAGGVYAGGLALVGERGPELINFRQGGYVHTATETTDILRRAMSGGGQQSNRELIEENRLLRRQVEKMTAYLYQIAKETKRTAQHTEPLERSSDDLVVVF